VVYLIAVIIDQPPPLSWCVSCCTLLYYVAYSAISLITHDSPTTAAQHQKCLPHLHIKEEIKPASRAAGTILLQHMNSINRRLG
jgi:hypothetical protein